MIACTGLRRAAAILLASLAGGCIENPEPDPRLFLPKPDRVEQWFGLSGMHGGLGFVFTRHGGITRLSVVNRIGRPIDSGVVLVRVWPKSTASTFYHLYPAPLSERMVDLSGLDPGDSLDCGVVDSLLEVGLDAADIEAVLLHADFQGPDLPHRYSGRYTGSWSAVDSAGREHRGRAEGLVDADGEYRLGLFDTVPGPQRATLLGFVQQDGSRPPALAITLATHGLLRSDLAYGGFSQKEGRFHATFGFADGAWVDTLAFELDKLPLP